MFLRIALSGLLLSAASARAEFNYLVKEGPWTIGGGKTHCEAMNRPPEEVNYAPINALFITEDEKRTPQIRIVFWPGALPEKVSEVEFTVLADGPQVFKVPAELGDPDWYNISTSGALPTDFIRLLESGGRILNMKAEVPGSKATTVFSLNSIDDALFSLHSCVTAMEDYGKN